MVDSYYYFSILSSSTRHEQISAPEPPSFLPLTSPDPAHKSTNLHSSKNAVDNARATSLDQNLANFPVDSGSVSPVNSLPRLLARAAVTDAGIVTYGPNADSDRLRRTIYRSLFETAKEKAHLLPNIDGILPSSNILMRTILSGSGPLHLQAIFLLYPLP